jgi:hypothetical protein
VKIQHQGNVTINAQFDSYLTSKIVRYSGRVKSKVGCSTIADYCPSHFSTRGSQVRCKLANYVSKFENWARTSQQSSQVHFNVWTSFVNKCSYPIIITNCELCCEVHAQFLNFELFPRTHVFFCLLYKQNSVKNNKTSVAMRFTTNDIFTRKNIVFFTCV